MPDLAILAADSMIENGLVGVLERREALGIREVTLQTWTHLERDPGCRLSAHDFLRPFASRFSRALVVFDLHGCGAEGSAADVEEEVEGLLARNGWGDRASVVAIDPELEVWVWSDSPEVPEVLGWDRGQPLRDWLKHRGLWPESALKPDRPKEALRAALRELRVPHSAMLFYELASRVSVQRCTDRSFEKLKGLLVEWFPAEGPVA